MTKNEFNENHWKFILKECETDQQRHSLEVIRDLCKASFKEYSDTRLIFYKNSENREVVWIRLKPKESPEIVIKLPAIINNNREVSKKTTSRYGFKLDVTGKLYSHSFNKSNNEKYHCIYQNNEFRFENLCKFRDVVIKILEEIPQDDFESLIQLIQYAIAN